ncbi:tRNA (guanosine(18)-2'-O)-methyltransferase TrmH [Glaciecola petra]|uniref:tRNA (guanosine(18)-2'-O)-methyltransferase n=1 Tax=Glaciecola petra TaxID=3075602 RepID=A0ABU2ZVM2_9ALTE|nr:tRNA (guanosine(18)-2'-O)-methyltransferase TrmH [Aestuariibacter sp. P117]MDT0596349.1 tRNA (guanosine(18)-2'-O)-methyltransferase TrmH [Aestuariibacter sp. P117]
MSAERYARIRHVLSKRQPDLTLLLEQVHKPHNVSAVIRTADAVGVHEIHTVWEDDYDERLRDHTAAGSNNWVGVNKHHSISGAVSALKKQNMQVLVTHLDESAVDYREIDYTLPTAIILGQELTGATQEAIALADKSIVIPMCGMTQSLNVSVATAVVLYEAQRQRQQKGFYDVNNRARHKQRVSEADIQRVLFQRGFPVLFEMCVAKNLSFPHINEHGEIDATQQWWDALKYNTQD